MKGSGELGGYDLTQSSNGAWNMFTLPCWSCAVH